mgnify:CR=1 FL=1
MCISCGRAYHEGRMCPRREDKIVCIDCCRTCEDYREKRSYMVCENPCRYHINHPAPKWAVFPKAMQMYEIEKEIEIQKKKADYCYERSWPKFAKEAETEVAKLKYRLKKLQEEKRKWEKEQESSR